jgi:hypothetical protein
MELRAVHLCLHSINSNPEGLIFQECLSELNTLFKRAETVVSEIDVLILEIITSAEQDGRRTLRQTENLKPSKLVWIRRKSKLSRLTLQVTSIVPALVATLQVLQSHQRITIHDPQQSVVIQSIGVIQEQPQSTDVKGSSAPPEHRTDPTNCHVIDEAAVDGTSTLPGSGSINGLSRLLLTHSTLSNPVTISLHLAMFHFAVHLQQSRVDASVNASVMSVLMFECLHG